MSVIQNAKISYASLGEEDHGIFTCGVGFEYGAWHIGLGGYALDEWDKELDRRIDKKGVGTEFLKGLMKAVGVTDFSKLKGQLVRIELDSEGLGAQVIGVGHIIDDEWFRPKEFFKQYYPEEE